MKDSTLDSTEKQDLQTNKEQQKGPVRKRIESLDILRGVAILGIFIININYFSTITLKRFNPTAHGDFSWLNEIIWILEYVLVKQRLMTIFAILFGAGIYLMAKHNREKGVKEAPVHFSRMFWLIVIGCIHAYLIWDGDILVNYACCGLLVYFLRNVSPKILITIGIVLVIGASWKTVVYLFNHQPASQELLERWYNPTEKMLEKRLSEFQGSWLEETPIRIKASFGRQTSTFISYTLWRVGGLMLIGMALMQLGFLTGDRPKKDYIKMLIISAGFGLPISFYGMFYYMKSNYHYDAFTTTLYVTFLIGSVILAFSYIALAFLFVKSEGFKRIKKSLAAIGRMALTNYIMQSVIGSLLFFGYGFGLYGKLNRIWLVAIILAVWFVQALYSTWWLKHFKFGPLEWVWRSLTYWKKQPFKLKPE